MLLWCLGTLMLPDPLWSPSNTKMGFSWLLIWEVRSKQLQMQLPFLLCIFHLCSVDNNPFYFYFFVDCTLRVSLNCAMSICLSKIRAIEFFFIEELVRNCWFNLSQYLAYLVKLYASIVLSSFQLFCCKTKMYLLLCWIFVLLVNCDSLEVLVSVVN